MPRARKEVDEVPDGLADQVERDVRAAGAVPLRTIKPTEGKLSRRAQSALFEQLGRRGLERTASALRVPLREQLAHLLDRGEPVASASLRRQLRGASAAELKLVTRDLVKAGRAALVTRSGKEHVAARSPALLAPAELAGLTDAVRALSRLLTSTRTRAGQLPRTLLRADAAAAIEQARRALGDDSGDILTLVLAAARAKTSQKTGLAYIPELARSLDGRLATDSFRATLLRAAGEGLIELRPESGIDLLSAADAEACPRGPDGSPLSWVRVLGNPTP